MFYQAWLLKTLLLPQLISNVIYVIIGHFFLYIQYKNYFERYSLNKTDKKNIQYRDLFVNLFINSTISSTIGILFLQILPTNIDPDIFIEKSYYVMIIKVFITFIISQFVFYFTHRFLHIKFMYKYIHYYHHKYEEPIALSANYSHPIEFFISTLPTITSGVIITEMSWVLNCFVWIPIITIMSLLDHSGYKIFLFNPSHHDNHHKMKIHNYSSFKIIDKIFGTYKC